MANQHKPEKYQVIYLGVKRVLTVPEWFRFLQGRNVFRRYSEGRMRIRLASRVEKRLSISQALGIVEPDLNLLAPKKDKQVFNNVGEQDAYDKVNELMRVQLARMARCE